MAKLDEHTRHEIRELIEETVKTTVREMRQNGLLKRSDDVAYNMISARLYEYYNSPEQDPEMGEALKKIKDDEFFMIIPEFYENRLAVKYIANEFPGLTSETTIWRNKKRLCLKLFSILQ